MEEKKPGKVLPPNLPLPLKHTKMKERGKEKKTKKEERKEREGKRNDRH